MEDVQSFLKAILEHDYHEYGLYQLHMHDSYSNHKPWYRNAYLSLLCVWLCNFRRDKAQTQLLVLHSGIYTGDSGD